MPKLLFEIIMSNQCNRRCEYCKLDLREQEISREYLDDMISFLTHYQWEYETVKINFFGGEPLLNFTWIEYFISQTQHLKNIQYSIGTNGILLDEKKFKYFQKHDVMIYLSVDSEIYPMVLQKQFLKADLSRVQLNFIVNPNSTEASFDLFDQCVEFGFEQINILPVMFSIAWTPATLKILQSFVEDKIIPLGDTPKINLVSYYNGVSSEQQYILDSDGCLYSDLDSLLWIQKQWDILSDELKHSIHSQTKIGKLSELSLQKLVDFYSIKDILFLVKSIPASQGFSHIYEVISKIFHGAK